MSLDERLARLRAAATTQATAGGVEVEAALRRTLERRDRRRRRRHAVGGALTAACALLVVALVVLLSATDDNGELVAVGGTDAPGSPPADVVDPDAVGLWLSATEVPAGTAELAAALVNPTGAESPTFGVAARLERWDDGAWMPFRNARLCLDFWLCRGEVVERSADLATEAIGLGAPAGRVGSILWLAVGELEPGMYRLAIDGIAGDQEGVEVARQFQILEAGSGTALPPARDLEPPGVVADPGIAASGPADIALSLVGLGTSDAVQATWATATTASLDRWTGERWEAAAELGTPREEPDGSERVVALPSLPEGAYRIIVSRSDGDDLEGRLWIDDLFGRDAPADDPASTDPTPGGSAGVPLAEVDWAAVPYPIDCGGTPTGSALAYTAPADGVQLAVVAVTCVAGAGSPPSAILVYDRADSPTSAHLLQTLVAYQDNWLPDPTGITAVDAELALAVRGYSSDDIARCCPDVETTLTWVWDGTRYEPTSEVPPHATLPLGG